LHSRRRCETLEHADLTYLIFQQISFFSRFQGAISAVASSLQLCSGLQILHHVSGVMHPGEVLALMGPSGSGKTSLLSVISGRAPRAVRTTGRVTVNGAHFTKAQKRRVGFVLQDDLLYETLTVSETLNYAAALRLPRGMTAAARKARVEAVISALGINKCKDTIIGKQAMRVWMVCIW
jgi:ABC-type multidrug transport system ATPase subunit